MPARCHTEGPSFVDLLPTSVVSRRNEFGADPRSRPSKGGLLLGLLGKGTRIRLDAESLVGVATRPMVTPTRRVSQKVTQMTPASAKANFSRSSRDGRKMAKERSTFWAGMGHPQRGLPRPLFHSKSSILAIRSSFGTGFGSSMAPTICHCLEHNNNSTLDSFLGDPSYGKGPFHTTPVCPP